MILYHFSASPPSRFALLTARNLDIDLEVRHVDLFKKEQLSEDFKKINPLHQVPVLVDGDLTISDSRAIACYLANLKAGNSIYPSDPRKRAVVDQYLFMDCSWIYPTWYDNAIKAVLAQTATTISPEAREKIHAMLTHLNSILSGSQYLCGEVVTLADLSVVGSIGVLIHGGMSFASYPSILSWFDRLKSIKGWTENEAGAEIFGKILKKFMTEPL